MPVIAIDGPSGSGKSSIARRIARHLQLPYLDTGAMYRALALAARRAGVDLSDADAVTEVARRAQIRVGDQPESEGVLTPVWIDGADVTTEIRTHEAGNGASTVGVHPSVRKELVRQQQAWVAEHGGGVVEGRDIGSVVCPDADVKIYLTASADERARRRSEQAVEGGDIETAAEQLAIRDHRDTSRTTDPLNVAEGAIVIDTTGCTFEEAVELVLKHL